MKTVLTAGYTFTPAQGTVSFAGVSGFDPRRLLAVIHVPTGTLLYAAGSTPALGAFAGPVLALATATAGLGASDALTVLYDADLFSPANPAATADVGLGADGATPPTIAGTGVRGWLRAIYERLTAGITVQGAVTVSDGSGPLSVDGAVSITNLPQTQPISAVALPLPAGAATDATLQAVAAALALLATHADEGAELAKLEQLQALLAAALTVQGTVTANIGTTAGLGLDASLQAILTRLGATLAISAASLPLPAGAATNALQSAGNASLASIVTALAGTLKTSDAANAAFATAASMTAGSSYAAGRSIGVNCTNPGTITLTLSGGGTINLPIYPGWQTFPFATTQFALPDAGAGLVYNLN